LSAGARTQEGSKASEDEEDEDDDDEDDEEEAKSMSLKYEPASEGGFLAHSPPTRCVGSEAGSYSRLIDFCITQLWA